MVEWLLKYPLAWYRDGVLTVDWSWQVYAALLAAAALLLHWPAGYRRLPRAGASRWLRTAALALLLLALARPALVVEAPTAIRGHVAVLLDDSLSMRLPGVGTGTRGEWLNAAMAADEGALTEALGERVEARYFRYGEVMRPVGPGVGLQFADPRSELGAALARLAAGPDQGSLAAVVVVGDGGVEAGAAARAELEQALLGLRTAGVPVHALALAPERPAADLELRGLRLPRRALVEDAVEVEVEIAHRRMGGQSAELVIEDDGLIVDRVPLVLPSGDGSLRLQRRLDFTEPGRRLLTARVAAEATEAVTENNRLERSIAVGGEPLAVLHFEGEPRFEVKFVRRAVARDPALRLVSLVRTADNKYYRLGVEQAEELAAGFPTTAAELFAYRVLVLGSVDAELLSPAQWQLVADFVARRGGGLLLLGGRRALARGGHQRSPLAELAPTYLAEHPSAYRAEVVAEPTPAGLADSLLELGVGESRQALFQRLPPLTVVNPLYRPKPGASVLLQGRDGGVEPLILLASRRHGAGRVMSFAVSNSWRWQMHASVPVQDQTHETLWRQLLRDLGRGVQGRVRAKPAETRTTPGQAVTLTASALDAEYRPAAVAELRLVLTSPLGEVTRQPLQRSDQGYGQYTTQFVAAEAGRYDLSVELLEGGEVVAAASDHVDVTTGGGEFDRLGEGRARLARIAAATGGRVLSPDQLGELPGLIDDARGQRKELKRLPLWDMPLLLLGLLGLVGADWVLRRARKLA